MCQVSHLKSVSIVVSCLVRQLSRKFAICTEREYYGFAIKLANCLHALPTLPWQLHSPPGLELPMTGHDSQTEEQVDGVLPPPAPPGFAEAAQAEVEEARKRKKLRLYCFHCNRPEGHSNPYLGAWFYSYFIGLTFGLLHFFGPFRCQCCGRSRLMFRNWAHPKFHSVMARNRAAAPSSRRSR